MKELLLAKRIDLWLQVLALLIPVAWAIARQDFFTSLLAYLTVGSVQVLSCIVNKIGLDKKLRHNGRGKYEKLLVAVLLIEGIALLWLWLDDYSSLRSILQVVLGALPFVSPFMAIWYMAMTKEELVMVRRLVERRVI